MRRSTHLMLNNFGTLFACSVLLTATAGTATAEEKAKDPSKTIAGTWQMKSAELGGRKLPESVLKSMKLIVKDGKYTIKSPGPDDTGELILNLKKKPHTLDIKGTDGPNKGKTIPAIFKRKDDTLTICYDLSGKKHPTEFKSTNGTLLFLVVYKQQKE